MNYYKKYSTYLNEKYGEKVYKLPINLPLTCPNRIDSSGCTFCSEVGTGFEAMDGHISVTEQLEKTKSYISSRYNAHKFIAYFQNFTNTFLPVAKFSANLEEAAQIEDIVEISVSTRPDCISSEYLDALDSVSKKYNINITIELGLQSANHKTLSAINRGHSLAEYIDAILQIKKYKFAICTHVILNLPYDTIEDCIETAKVISALGTDIVKIHSLYIAKGTALCEDYVNRQIAICSKEEYLERVCTFLEYVSPDMIIERLFSRIPKEDMVFSNWETSWWKLQDELLEKLEKEDRFQGKYFNYLNGSALSKLQ